MKWKGVVLFVFLLLPGCRSEKPPAGQNLTLSVPHEIDTLDPHRKNKISSYAVIFHFYESLVIPTGETSVKPGLAQLWENPDSHTWIFHLRKSVRFHSGKMLTADDVLYSFERLKTETGLERSGYVSGITEVKALDPYRIRIRTARPLSVLLGKVSYVPIIPKGSAGSLDHEVNGTGPYKLVEWKQQAKHLRLIRNEDYWQEKPHFSVVNILYDRTSTQASEDLLSGKSDLIQCNSKQLSESLRSRGYHVVEQGSPYVKYIGFNYARQDNPFRNLLVRQAMNSSIDRRELISQLDVYAVPATQPLPPFTFGYSPTISLPEPSVKRAIDLLKQAGYLDGISETMHVRRLYSQAAHIVQKQVARAGIQLQLKEMSDIEFFQELGNSNFKLFFSRYGAPTGDASDVLDIAFHSYDPKNYYGLQNYGRYSNPILDKEIQISSEISILEERREKLEEIMSMITKELVWIPLYIDQEVYAFRKGIQWKPRNDGLILATEISE